MLGTVKISLGFSFLQPKNNIKNITKILFNVVLVLCRITGKGFAKLRQKRGCHSFGGVILQNPCYLLFLFNIHTANLQKQFQFYLQSACFFSFFYFAKPRFAKS